MTNHTTRSSHALEPNRWSLESGSCHVLVALQYSSAVPIFFGVARAELASHPAFAAYVYTSSHPAFAAYVYTPSHPAFAAYVISPHFCCLCIYIISPSLPPSLIIQGLTLFFGQLFFLTVLKNYSILVYQCYTHSCYTHHEIQTELSLCGIKLLKYN